MDGSKVGISDILGSDRININTPILVLTNVNKWFFKKCNKSLCDLDTQKLYKYIEKGFRFIDKFVPVGQIKISDKAKQKYTIILANSRIIPISNSYELIKKNVWIGVIRKGDKISRSLGTVYSQEKPSSYIPVFPESFLKKSEHDYEPETSIYSDLYSDASYGRWVFTPYNFSVDKRQLKIIDSSGEITNMTIPDAVAYHVTPNSVIDDSYSDSGKKYNRNVYFTAQGSIVSDDNCVPAQDNMDKMFNKECNARDGSIDFIDTSFLLQRPDVLSLLKDKSPVFSPREIKSAENSKMNDNIKASDDDSLALNEESKYVDAFALPKRDSVFKIGKTLVLKENEEPWFMNSAVVGTAAASTNPQKITGKVDETIGTLYGNIDEIDAPFKSDCVIDPTEPRSGYSRYDKYQSCVNNKRDSTGYDDDYDSDTVEQFSSSTDYMNNVIMYVLCIIIVALLLYRKS